MTELAAVLWDMDGTLVDSEPYWIEVEKRLVEEHGGTWSEAGLIVFQRAWSEGLMKVPAGGGTP